MKVHRSQFAKLKLIWNMKQMQSAYIAAERAIMQDPSLTEWQEPSNVKVSYEVLTPEEFNKLHEPVQAMTLKDIQIENLKAELTELETLGRQLLEDEKYELMQEAKEMYDIIKHRLDKLLNNG